jgi:phosphate acetyltransferase
MPVLEAEAPVGRNAHDKFHKLVANAQKHPPVKVAVAHPCDKVSLESALEAASLKLIEPILVGPEHRIREVAAQNGLDISRFEIVDADYSQDSAAKAVELVREGRAEALMKGSLHTDELMGAVVKRDTGLRTSRRISHCFIMDVPDHDQPLIITDAAVNIAPDLKGKVDITQNAIDLAHALGQTEVRVAILSAMESVNPDVPSTLDNAISPEAAAIKKINSPVAGRANVLVVPDLEAGNMLAKSLSFLADADAAGIVLGAKVPIILTSRADEEMARLASCAVAQLLVAARRANASAAIQ